MIILRGNNCTFGLSYITLVRLWDQVTYGHQRGLIRNACNVNLRINTMSAQRNLERWRSIAILHATLDPRFHARLLAELFYVNLLADV